MHAVVVTVTIRDREAAESELRNQLVPWASHTQGFIAGYWTIKDTSGLTMILYESEDAANRMSEQTRSAAPGAVTLDSVECARSRRRPDRRGPAQAVASTRSLRAR